MDDLQEPVSTDSEKSSAMAKVFYALKNYNYKTLDYFLEKQKEKLLELKDASAFETKRSIIYEFEDERMEIFFPKDLDSGYKPKNAIKGAKIIEFVNEHGYENVCLVTITYDDGDERSFKNNIHLLKKEPETDSEMETGDMHRNYVARKAFNRGWTLKEFKDVLVNEFKLGLTFTAFCEDFELKESGDIIYEVQSGKDRLRIERFDTIKVTYEEGKNIESEFITMSQQPKLIVEKLND